MKRFLAVTGVLIGFILVGLSYRLMWLGAWRGDSMFVGLVGGAVIGWFIKDAWRGPQR